MTDDTTEPAKDLQTEQTPEDSISTEDVIPGSEENPETFPREYVERLRSEAAESRLKAKKADDLARQLFTARVAATGRLADPNDLAFDENLLDDLPGLEAAIEALIADHPHYAARTPRGTIGQGHTDTSDHVDLAGMLRARA